MKTLLWHEQKALECLDDSYLCCELYLQLCEVYGRKWFTRQDMYECKQQALKYKTLGLVFHDRFKLLLENKS